MAGNASSAFAAASCLVVAVLIVVVTVPVARAQAGLPLVRVIRIAGTVSCAVNSTAVTSSTPAFPNASVQLQCGNGTVASATTNAQGAFSILLDPVTAVLSSLLNNCKLVVVTPLATCNATLPSRGQLQSVLSPLGSTIQGLLSVVNFGPGGFNLALNQ